LAPQRAGPGSGVSRLRFGIGQGSRLRLISIVDCKTALPHAATGLSQFPQKKAE
jgi:hypothetical protein